MLPQKHRLPGYLISYTVRNGRQVSIWPMSLFAVKRTKVSDEPVVSRFAFLVPKKSAKRAVERNRIKRLLRESLQHLLPTLPFPIDAVMIVKGSIEEKTQMEVEKKTNELFSTLFGI